MTLNQYPGKQQEITEFSVLTFEILVICLGNEINFKKFISSAKSKPQVDKWLNVASVTPSHKSQGLNIF
jgi:hypothetical protein